MAFELLGYAAPTFMRTKPFHGSALMLAQLADTHVQLQVSHRSKLEPSSPGEDAYMGTSVQNRVDGMVPAMVVT
eukprot:2722532-Amphidinium_carterae.1